MADDDNVTVGRPVAVAEVKALLERELAARGDLAYEQKLALDHSTALSRVKPENVPEMIGKLKALGGKVTEWHAYKIVDLTPKHADDVRAIFVRDRVAPEQAEIDKILEIVNAYL